VFASVSVSAFSPSVALIGGYLELGRTTNAGETWTVEAPSQTDWFSVSALPGASGWAGGQDQNADEVPGSIWRRLGLSSGGELPSSRPETHHTRRAPPSSTR
jgi:hypothetical protein